MKDVYNLQRFIDAQDQVFEHVVQELVAGQKRGHWMWYIFPQIKGLGFSVMAQRYAISSEEEAVAYMKHPILGARLRQCTKHVINVAQFSIEQIFYYPDYLKFHSSMTLFMTCSKDNQLYKEALNKYFDGQPDKATLDILKRL